MRLNRVNSAIGRTERNKLNENFDILERGYGKSFQDSQIAKEQSDYAVETSDEAKQKADSVQSQLDQVVIQGDSSVEAAQARVSADATTYATLKARLDAEYTIINQQLTQIAVNVNQFPRLATETVDTGRIQRALDFIASQGGGTVMVSDAYVVDDTIDIPNNTALIGGYGNSIKVDDDCTGFYSLFRIHSKENVTISGINYDGNVDRANYSIDTPGKPEIAIYIVNSKNVKITNNHLKTCGIWTISCEVSENYPYNDFIYIQDNVVDYTVGKSIDRVGPMMRVDTTQFYIDAKNYWVERNTLNTLNSGSDVAETAIEAHRSMGTVRDNIVNGFRNGVLIVPGFFAEEYDSTLISISNNKFYNVLSGVTLWQISVRDLANVNITDNSFEINPSRFENPQNSYGVCTLDALPNDNGNKKITNVSIQNNIIKFLPFDATYLDPDFTQNFCGIKLFSYVSIKNAKITNNQIIDAPSIGIFVGARGDASYPNKADGIDVTNNTIINAGKNTNISAVGYNPRTPIRVTGNAGASAENIIVRDNTIIDDKETGTYFTVDAMVAATNTATTAITNNTYVCKGKELLNVKRAYDVPIGWDSQVGAPIVSKSASCLKTSGGVKFDAYIAITDLNGFTQGYGCFITLPIAPTQNAMLPIVITGAGSVSRQWFLELVEGNTTAYIKGIEGGNTITSLVPSYLSASTKISINIEYLD